MSRATLPFGVEEAGLAQDPWSCRAMTKLRNDKTCLRFAPAALISFVPLSQELEVDVLKSLDDEKT
jgi:hypothetical protein